ncbi:MAG: hypothetical protein H6Q90_4572 [Deltaproteobacteria bacterium]|nr:hypothetical protein [Deltaproteobacteria bacterium]
MRVLALIGALGDGSPTLWVETMAAILIRAQRLNDVDSLLVLECIIHAAADEALHYEARQGLYEAAIARDLPAIARLFLSISPAVAVPTQLKKQLGPERRLIPTGRLLTLGERKSLARTHDREKLGKMIADPHPAVVTILLDNPHITELDVVRIAAMRPAVPEALAKVAAHTKWSVRHAIKRALVLNPSTPLADAIRIATTLRATELAELAADVSLPEPLRLHAAELRAATRHGA